jgi:hypothetical protein
MSCIHKEAIATMPITDLLVFHSGHHLLLFLMYGVKMIEEVYVWVPAVCQMV